MVRCKVKKAKRAEKVKVICRVRTVAATRVALRHGERTVATRRVRAGAHRLVFRVATRGGGRYTLRAG